MADTIFYYNSLPRRPGCELVTFISNFIRIRPPKDGAAAQAGSRVDRTRVVGGRARRKHSRRHSNGIHNRASDRTGGATAITAVGHNLHQAARVNDHVGVFLTGGVLAEFGPTKKAFAASGHPDVQDYLAGRFG